MPAAVLVLALAMLTTVRLLLFLPLAVIWAVMPWTRRRDRITRETCASWWSCRCVLLVGAWAFRNDRLIAAPVLSTESGLSLWIATHPIAMTVLPNQTIDLVEERALARS